jgi:modulator of FtsH protease HflC
MTWSIKNPMVIAIIAVFAAILLSMSLSIVPETRQGVVLRFEQPVGTINRYKAGERFGSTDAGPQLRWPFIERIVWVDKRVLDIELDNQQVLSIDQLRLEVDAFARFRVVDPLRMVTTARTEQGVIDALRPILGSALRNELGKRPFAALLSPERGQVMENIQTGLQNVAGQYGVEIVDVRIKQAGLPTGSPLDSALERMRTARSQEALTIRAQGERQAQIIRAEADAQAAQIYAASFGKDAEFYNFWRAMQSYRYTFNQRGDGTDGETAFVLSPDNAYLQQFRAGGR